MIKRFKKPIKTIVAKGKGKLNLLFSKKIYVSYGENCLTDNILQRHFLKSLTTPFSHGRSNVEYILQLERDNYKDFLNPEYLRYEVLGKKEVPRLKKYNVVDNQYNDAHENGFEFTHHDVINNESHRFKMNKRVHALRKLNGRKKFIILYHHRSNSRTNIDLLLKHLQELKELYSSNSLTSEVICFTQNIISDTIDRKLSYAQNNGIHYFIFHTMNEWAGDNNDIFWAKCDEDLIVQMLSIVKKL
jgi:glycosyltransferase involved in cell wall biosynthesis